MPPGKRRSKYIGKHTHCCIWWRGDGAIVIGCAHCRLVTHRVDVSLTYDDELLMRQVRASRKQHSNVCTKPIYSA